MLLKVRACGASQYLMVQALNLRYFCERLQNAIKVVVGEMAVPAALGNRKSSAADSSSRFSVSHRVARGRCHSRRGDRAKAPVNAIHIQTVAPTTQARGSQWFVQVSTDLTSQNLRY
jgi:hypothetical protein